MLMRFHLGLRKEEYLGGCGVGGGVSSFTMRVPVERSLVELLVSLSSPWEIQKDLAPGPTFPWAWAPKGLSQLPQGLADAHTPPHLIPEYYPGEPPCDQG